MYCKKCGNKLDDDSVYCSKCGARQSALESVESSAASEEKKNRGNELIKNRTAIIICIAAVAIVVMVGAGVLAFIAGKGVGEKIAEQQGGSTVASSETANDNSSKADEISGKEDSSTSQEESDEQEKAESEAQVLNVEALSRPLFADDESQSDDLSKLVPSVPKWEIASDLSNLINQEQIYWLQDDLKKHLVEDGFAVSPYGFDEFFEVYEFNRYGLEPSFVTVDSLMHTYHIYFAYLLKGLEKEHLSDDVNKLTDKMLASSISQYEEVKGTKWEEAALRNVAFFSVGKKLLDSSADVRSEVASVVDAELKLIGGEAGVDVSPLFGVYEDYSQYKPRGYYEGDVQLEKYFRAMMWYGRMQFDESVEDMDRSALLMTLALNDGNLDDWESIYSVTSFFSGSSDDLMYYDYMPVIDAAYGKGAALTDIVSNEPAWRDFHVTTAWLRAPRINSIPIDEGDDNVILGYRFMGQRFSIDATVMQELIYSRVGDENNKRMLPDVLDVAAALGSSKAYEILDDNGATSYKNYPENMKKLQAEFDNDDNLLWNASLYAKWLHTLKPLLEKKGEGYPAFMQTDKWTRKTLETFAGSYTELKHDTILYSKQAMAEMGGGWEEDIDDRGYVEPEPVVYSRFEQLSRDTADGLDKYGYLKKEDKDNLNKLAELARQLKEISVKELNNELPTEDEFELIRCYGGELEHIWLDVMRTQSGKEYVSSEEYPSALVVDIATDPNGAVLEAGTGRADVIYVIVEVDGKLRMARGSVYSFYQFEQPINDRLTDTKWRKMLGITIDDYNNPDKDIVDVPKPEWTRDYRIQKD